MARPVAYGCVNEQVDNVEVWADASVPFQANGGKWVHVGKNASRTAVLCSGTITSDILGWAEVGTFSSSSTVGQDKITVNVHPEARFEMPINATQTEEELRLLMFKSCDIDITNGIQYANYSSASDNTLHIVGYKYYGEGTGEQSLLVKLNATIFSVTKVA